MLRQRLVALSLPLAPAQVTLPAPPPLLRPLSLSLLTHHKTGAIEAGAHHT
ncbi:hypothetical protein HaLaN_23378, partial [Haematococcus lacustris]